PRRGESVGRAGRPGLLGQQRDGGDGPDEPGPDEEAGVVRPAFFLNNPERVRDFEVVMISETASPKRKFEECYERGGAGQAGGAAPFGGRPRRRRQAPDGLWSVGTSVPSRCCRSG